MNTKFYLRLTFLSFFLIGIATSFAFSAEGSSSDSDVFIYEKPTRQTMSRIYWRMGLMDKKNNSVLDEYLLINECDLYKEYISNDVDWANVRDSGRNFLEKNAKNFNTRIRLSSDILLGEYDPDNQIFHVANEYKIKRTRKLASGISDAGIDVCGRSAIKVKQHTVDFIIELTRPFEFTSFQLSPREANRFISIRVEEWTRSLEEQMGAGAARYLSDKSYMMKSRKAYLDISVQIVAGRGYTYISETNYAILIGVVESVNLYADLERRWPLYSKTYIRKNVRGEHIQKEVTPEVLEDIKQRVIDAFSILFSAQSQ